MRVESGLLGNARRGREADLGGPGNGRADLRPRRGDQTVKESEIVEIIEDACGWPTRRRRRLTEVVAVTEQPSRPGLWRGTPAASGPDRGDLRRQRVRSEIRSRSVVTSRIQRGWRRAVRVPGLGSRGTGVAIVVPRRSKLVRSRRHRASRPGRSSPTGTNVLLDVGPSSAARLVAALSERWGTRGRRPGRPTSPAGDGADLIRDSPDPRAAGHLETGRVPEARSRCTTRRHGVSTRRAARRYRFYVGS